MKRTLILSLALGALIIAGSCKSDDSEEPSIDPLEAPTSLALTDFGNQGDARDLYVSFERLGNETNVQSYNLILSKAGTNLAYTEAAALAADRMYAIAKTGTAIKHQVQSSFRDSDGDAIQNDQCYNAYILATSTLEGQTGSLSSRKQIELNDIPYFEVRTLGSYPGLEALSYYQGTIIAAAIGGLIKIDVASGSHSTLDNNPGGPLGGGFDPEDGTYYGSMYNSGDVLKYDLDGNSTVFASGFTGPIGIAVDAEKNVYVTNFDGNTISKVSPEGNKSLFVNNSSGAINGPDGIVLAKGNLYSINFWDSRVFKISSSGEPSLLARLPGTGNGYIAYADDYFYATSYAERKVFRIDMDGNYDVIAGSGHPSSTDGPAQLASFTNPNGIAVAGDTIFVGDDTRLRMVIRHE